MKFYLIPLFALAIGALCLAPVLLDVPATACVAHFIAVAVLYGLVQSAIKIAAGVARVIDPKRDSMTELH